MAIIPKISISLNNLCNKVTITEQTGIYVVTSNEGGWGTPNIDTDDIVTAKVEIYNSAGTTLETTYTMKDTVSIDVYTSAVSSPIPPEFIAYNEETWTLPDGIYQIKYSITDISTTYYNETQYELFLCNLCTCKDNLVLKLIAACDPKKVKELKDKVDQMEIFIYGIKCAFSCGDFDTAETLLTSATNYCQTLSDCGCGCGGC